MTHDLRQDSATYAYYAGKPRLLGFNLSTSTLAFVKELDDTDASTGRFGRSTSVAVKNKGEASSSWIYLGGAYKNDAADFAPAIF